MSRTSPSVPVLDRLLFLLSESSNPEIRLKGSLFLLVAGIVLLIEVMLMLSAIIVGLSVIAAVHGALAAVITGSFFLFRNRSPGFFAVELVLVAWISSLASLTLGMGYAALFWHLVLPTASLLLNGERWGWGVLGADIDDPFRLAVLDADPLRQDPARLADEAAQLSLLGGRRVVRVRDADDRLAKTLATVLEAPPGGALVVVEAGDLSAG